MNPLNMNKNLLRKYSISTCRRIDEYTLLVRCGQRRAEWKHHISRPIAEFGLLEHLVELRDLVPPCQEHQHRVRVRAHASFAGCACVGGLSIPAKIGGGVIFTVRVPTFLFGQEQLRVRFPLKYRCSMGM